MDSNFSLCMPHVCGDEPHDLGEFFAEVIVCPTYVGMNHHQ